MQQNPIADIKISTSISFLFNYIWLFLELNVIVWAVVFGDNSKLIMPFAILLFALIYFWLNFSRETLFQTIYMLVFGGLCFLLPLFSSTLLMWGMIYSVLLGLLVLGTIRIRTTIYVIQGNEITVKRVFSENTYSIENNPKITSCQTAAGKQLNFGSILIETTDQKPSSLHFLQRKGKSFNKAVRIDGIPDVDKYVYQLKKHFS